MSSQRYKYCAFDDPGSKESLVDTENDPGDAWNEFGEGGIVAPTKGRGHMMLQCIKDVFGTSDPAHEGRAPKQTETK